MVRQGINSRLQVADGRERDVSGTPGVSKTWRPKHRDGTMGQAPKPQSGASPGRALRATTVPVEMNVGCWDSVVERGWLVGSPC
jgi:hypothetical protein